MISRTFGSVFLVTLCCLLLHAADSRTDPSEGDDHFFPTQPHIFSTYCTYTYNNKVSLHKKNIYVILQKVETAFQNFC